MSENGFHVHGAHEHAVEHADHHGPSLAQSVAIFTAILSTLGAIVSYQGGATQNEALLYKNEAILKKSQASDQWNYYQAKSTKGHLMELARDLAPPGKKAEYESLIQKYAQEMRKSNSRLTSWSPPLMPPMNKVIVHCARTTSWRKQ